MKKVLKRVVAFILTLAMCMGTTGAAASAEVSVTTGGVQSSWDGMTTEDKYAGENFSVRDSILGSYSSDYSRWRNACRRFLHRWCWNCR